MDSIPKDLYKWQRLTSKTSKPSLSTHKATDVTDDIKDWIRKVEQASEFAAAQAFGKARVKNNVKDAVLCTIDQLHDHDDAFNEAQVLLKDWLQDQQIVNIADDDIERRIWTEEECIESDSYDPSIKNIIQQEDADSLSMEEYDRLMNLDDYNEDSTVRSILDQLKQKEVVKPSFLLDLGEIGGKPTVLKPQSNPAVKMQIRLNQAKEAREKRHMEVKRKKELEMARKEALVLAKQKAAEERKQALVKAKMDELEIQKEMARIRKELQEQRKEQLRKQEEERELMRKVELAAKANAAAAHSQQAISDNVKLDRVAHDTELRRLSTINHERNQRLVKAIEISESKFTAINLKLLRGCFNCWFDVVIQRRMQLGRAKAVSDWKCLFRVWNAWRNYCKQKNLNKLTELHVEHLKEEQRKYQLAVNHCEKKLLRRYFLYWKVWVLQELQSKETAKEQLSVRSKISNFLTTGQLLLQQNKTHKENCKNDQEKQKSIDAVEELFLEKNPLPSSRSVSRKNTPNEAWQVTRQHVRINRGRETFNAEPGEKASDEFAEAISEPATNRSVHDIPKDFQSRFKAQQKMLQEQQKALKEQKRMIEDMKFYQQKELLEQQLKQQQLIQEQLEKLTKAALQERKTNMAEMKHPAELPVNTEAETVVTSRSGASATSKATSAQSSVTKTLELRAQERAKLKQEREERKRKQEEERVAAMLAKEEENKAKEAEEKRQRVEAYKEKKRLEQMRELELQQAKETAMEAQRKADEFSKLRTMKYYGFNQLKKHCITMKEKSLKAQMTHQRNLQMYSFSCWRTKYDFILSRKNNKADQLHRMHLLKEYFSNWKRWKSQSEILSLKADRHYRNHLIDKVFQEWLDLTTREKVELWEKERRARQHDSIRMKRWVITTWRDLPQERKREEEREKRKEQMRQKVASLLSDYRTDSTIQSELLHPG